MEIKRVGTQPSAKGPSEWSTGTVRIDPLFQAPDPALVQGAGVTFEPGARTAYGTRIHSVRLSSSRRGVAARNGGADRSRTFGRAMWSGSRPTKNTGMELRRPPP